MSSLDGSTGTADKPWLEGLPEGDTPDRHPPGECPWAMFERASHETWGYRTGDALVVRDLATAKEVMSERRFQQGLQSRIAEKAPDVDPRFLERRKTALLGLEGPDHLRMRRLASKIAFTPRAANRHRPLMQEVMGELADQIPADGLINVVDLVHDYPSRIIAQILGSREDEVLGFSEAIDIIFAAQSGVAEAKPKAWEAQTTLDDFLNELIERKREEPGEDLLTDLIRAESEEGVLSTAEIHIIASAVVMAGTETTRNQLSRGLHLLAEHPAIWSQLTDDDALGAAVEEILRFAPLAPVRRIPSEDLPVGDRVVPEGEVVMIDFGAANRDPEVVDDPDAFRIDREGPSVHLTLGHGHKYCLGANLARAEMVEALRVLRARFPKIELAEPAEWTSERAPRGHRIMIRFT